MHTNSLEAQSLSAAVHETRTGLTGDPIVVSWFGELLPSADHTFIDQTVAGYDETAPEFIEEIPGSIIFLVKPELEYMYYANQRLSALQETYKDQQDGDDYFTRAMLRLAASPSDYQHYLIDCGRSLYDIPGEKELTTGPTLTTDVLIQDAATAASLLLNYDSIIREGHESDMFIPQSAHHDRHTGWDIVSDNAIRMGVFENIQVTNVDELGTISYEELEIFKLFGDIRDINKAMRSKLKTTLTVGSLNVPTS